MRLFVLKADRPISKVITKTGLGYETNPYPNIRDFTSSEFTVNNIDEMHQVIEATSNNGHTILKGELKTPLTNQSRAGSTDAHKTTEWVCLDIDTDTPLNINHEDLLTLLHPGLAEASYIYQHSASDGITCQPGTRYHLFIMLDKPISPNILKQWLLNANLKHDVLRERVQLSANGNSLKYPLDITTCQNDKLLYVAPPHCQGFVDPIDTRTEVVHRAQPTGNLDGIFNNAEVNRELSTELINQLREKQGLKPKKAKYKQVGSHDVMTNPDFATVTGIKTERGFVYLNLNNGDSWGYYHPENNPQILYNFKGEPPVYTKDIVPDYFRDTMSEKEAEFATQPFCFHEPRTDTYFTGVYLSKSNTIHALNSVSSKDKIKDFLAQYDLPMPDPIEDWTLEFNPTTNMVFDPTNRWINKFKPTSYMKDRSTPCAAVPSIINKVLRSICVDKETYDHFINWLAALFQTRKKLGTAWIFHGAPGTGKGILHERILAPLFGVEHTPKVTIQQLEEQFNSFTETALITWVDEVKMNNRSEDTVQEKLKHMITEETTTIRALYRNPITATSYNNIILATNHRDPLYIAPNDRRYNVAPAQETPISITAYEIDLIRDELPYFAAYLRDYSVNMAKTRQILQSKARDLLIKAAEKTVDTFFNAIKTGDIDYFFQYITAKPRLTLGNTYIDFERAVKRWCAAAVNNEDLFMSRDEMLAAYAYLQNKPNTSSTAFSRMCAIQRITIYPGKINGVPVRGTHVKPKLEDRDSVKEYVQAENVIQMKQPG